MNTHFENLAYFTRHSSGPVPYSMQLCSRKEGHHVVIVGGTHGNEPSGVNAMIWLHKAFKEGEIALSSGKISLVLGNPKAYENHMRYVDRDLNRAFGDRDASSVEGNRAIQIRDFFSKNPQIKALLDLHSVSKGDFKILVYEKDNPSSLQLAERISSVAIHFAYHAEHMPGTLIEEACKQGIAAFIVECGNHLSEQGTITALEHINAILLAYNLVDKSFIPSGDEVKAPPNIMQYESIQPIKPHGNFVFLVRDVTTGTKLAKGQSFAKDDHGYHLAPEDCYVVVPSKEVKPTDHDAGFLCRLNLLQIQESN